MELNEAYLILENGSTYKGRGFGAQPQGQTQALGEVVFTTGMTGYIETLTDPSYYGQIVTMTFPMIGNYGIIPSDFESGFSFIKGFIVKEHCTQPSNFRSEGTLDDFLKQQGIPGLYGIDTRALTKELRDEGVMNGVITNNPDAVDMDKLRAYKIGAAISKLKRDDSTQFAHYFDFDAATRRSRHIGLWDLGAKGSILNSMNDRAAGISVYPYMIKAEEILEGKPDGVLISNGPGDPAAYPEIIEEIRKLSDSGVPIFGICLGHQLLALARGGSTAKMKFGHRGANHPVRDNKTGRVFITSQNHGYAVDKLPPGGSMRYINANDLTCEGIEYTDFPGFSVQFHPEAAAGPNDTNFLFDKFINMMGGK